MISRKPSTTLSVSYRRPFSLRTANRLRVRSDAPLGDEVVQPAEAKRSLESSKEDITGALD